MIENPDADTTLSQELALTVKQAEFALSQTLADGASLSALSEAKSLLLLAVRIYANQTQMLQNSADQQSSLPALPQDGELTATEVLITVTALLKAVRLDPFELGMWQALG